MNHDIPGELVVFFHSVLIDLQIVAILISSLAILFLVLQMSWSNHQFYLKRTPSLLIDYDSIKIKNNKLIIKFINDGQVPARNIKIEYCVGTNPLSKEFADNRENYIDVKYHHSIFPNEKIIECFNINNEIINNNNGKIYCMFQITFNRRKSKRQESIYVRTIVFERDDDSNKSFTIQNTHATFTHWVNDFKWRDSRV